jgi:AcrR family transcriptional regulator
VDINQQSKSGELARLRDAAARLFATLGYDNTTTEMLINTAGVSREAVTRVGGRSGLYRDILERFCGEQCDMLDEVASGLTPGDDRLRIVLTSILDYHLNNMQHREVLAIWRQRWMMDAADLFDIESHCLQPIRQKVITILGPEIVETREFRLIIATFTLCLMGFATCGALDTEGSVLDPNDPRDRLAFRSYMCELLEKLRGGVT